MARVPVRDRGLADMVARQRHSDARVARHILAGRADGVVHLRALGRRQHVAGTGHGWGGLRAADEEGSRGEPDLASPAMLTEGREELTAYGSVASCPRGASLIWVTASAWSHICTYWRD